MTALEVPGALVAFGRSALKDLTGTVLQRFRGLTPRVDVQHVFDWNGSKPRLEIATNEDLAGRALPARNEIWVPHSTITPDSPQGVTRQFISAAASENVEGRRAAPMYFVHLAARRPLASWNGCGGIGMSGRANCSRCGWPVMSSPKRTKNGFGGICRPANGSTGM